jgi:hypothetical protein
MTATGAKNKTREQMLAALSLTESTIVKVPEHLNKFKNIIRRQRSSYRTRLSTSAKIPKQSRE